MLKLVRKMAETWFAHRSDMVFHDPLAAALVLDETLCEVEMGDIAIDPSDGRTSFTPNTRGPHRIATGVHADAFFRVFFAAFE
jgi:purine nucleosidase